MDTRKVADEELAGLEPEQLVGQLLVTGFDGPALPDRLREDLRHGRRAGVILFRRNIEGLEQTRALSEEIASVTHPAWPALVAIDEEGGRVRRLVPPALALPPMRQLAAEGNVAFVERVFEVLGRQLRCLGVTLDFAPVVDVDTNPDNPVIGDRAFGADPETVVRFAGAVMAGLRAGGVSSCLKHFPGHGDTLLDSHLALPTVSHGRERLERVELEPFRSLAPAADSIMTAHVVYPALDGARPATLSPTILRDLLRRELGFEGALFSDDLEMRGITDGHAPETAAVLALEAGCDLLLVCHDAELQARVHRALVERVDADDAFRATCLVAARRSLALRRRRPPRPGSAAELEQVLRDEVAPLQAELQRRALVA